MKLFIDDIRYLPGDDWTLARTINAAISAIDTFDFDVISLDHDISHQVSVGMLSRPFPCEETFTAVAYFIREKYKNTEKKPDIIIHTSNPAGAVKMAGILDGFNVTRKFSDAANRLEMEVKD